MKLSENFLGLTFAFGASLSLAISLAMGKSALNEINMVQFGFVWFALGSIFNFLWYTVRNYKKGIFNHSIEVWKTGIMIAIPDAIATGLFFIAIKKMENPAIVSFIGNLGPVIVTILGITVLKERFGTIQITGIALTLMGIFLLSFSKGRVLQEGSGYVIMAAVLFALCTIIARSRRDSLHPELMSTLRSALLFLFFVMALFISGTDLSFSYRIWTGLSTGAFLESFLTIVLSYQALKYLEATKTSLIISSKALWLLIIAYIFLGVLPPSYQITGGILTMVGIVLINMKRNYLSSRRYS